MAVTVQSSVTRTVSLSAVAVAASVAVPFLVHSVPSGQALGSALLPIFWAPLIAALVFGTIPAFAAALLAPALNHLVTGMPPTPVLPSLTLELVLFVTAIVVFSRVRSLRRTPALGLLAYFAARIVAGLLLVGAGSMAAFFGSLGSMLPGLIALLLVNWGVLLLRRNVR